MSSFVASPKRGASAGAGATERGELVALACLGRELLRLLAGLRATDPPAWRWRGDAALRFALSESALLGERAGEAPGAGLKDRGLGSPPACAGVGGGLPSASTCGLTRLVLTSLWRGEALLPGAVVLRWSGWRGGRVSSVGGAASFRLRKAAAA